MANLLFVGMNGGALSSKGIQIYRRGNKVRARWGAVVVSGAANKRVRWLGKHMEQVHSFRSEDAAARHLSEYLRAKLAKGYAKIPATRGIHAPRTR